MMLRSAIMLAAVAAATATAPGIRASVSSAGLQYIVGVAIPMIEKKFSTINIPDYSTKTHDVTVDLTSATCHLESLGSGSLSSDPGQGVAGQITGISVSCAAHVHARLDIWPHPSCSFDLDGSVGGGSASLVLDITNNAGHPELVSKSIDVNVGDFDIHFHGGICSIVADLIKDIADTFFKKTVDHLVEKEIDSVLGTFISNDANKIINSIPLDIPLPFKAPYDIADIDFTLSDSPAFETGYIGIDVVGAIVNAQTKAPAPFPAPTIPAFSSSSAAHYIQLFLSPYVLESAVWTFQQAGLVKFNVKHSLIPASFPVQLNTTDLALIAPGIKTAFPDDWVDIEVTMPLSEKATITASPSGVAAAVPLQLEFNAVTASGDKNAFVLGCDFEGDILLTAETNSSTGFPMIAGNLSYLKCPLSVVSSNVGTVSPVLAATLVDLILGDIITPLVNVLLKVGIPLPTIDGLSFTQLELINGNGYVQIATDFTYSPTAAQDEPALLDAPMPFAPLAGAKPALRGMA